MTFQFVAWSRRGASAEPGIGAADADGRRHVAPVTRVVAERDGQASPPNPVASPPLAILGPGDVIGIDPAQVVRRAPRPDEHTFEPNYLAAIEFAHPDLPWLFSPVAQDGRGKAMPWLMLVVVDVEPGHEQAELTVRPGAPNPVLEVPDARVLPNAADAWAWAHVQVHRPSADEALRLLATPSPGWSDVRSRLVAPTHIEPEHAYLACVVPVYAAGREAGLAASAPTGLGLALAWEGNGSVALPVYDHWRFRAGPAGDFETLARKLHPVEDVPNLGQRMVAVEPVASRLQTLEARSEDGELFPAAVPRGAHRAGARPARRGRSTRAPTPTRRRTCGRASRSSSTGSRSSPTPTNRWSARRSTGSGTRRSTTSTVTPRSASWSRHPARARSAGSRSSTPIRTTAWRRASRRGSCSTTRNR